MSDPHPASYPPAPCPHPVPEGSWTVFAHRGASSLAPENTLAAFRLAARLGAQWVELDVDVIGDGTPIVIHDSSLDRTTNRTGSYYDLTVADLAGIDAGSWFEADSSLGVDGTRPFAGEPLPTLAAALEVAIELGLGVNVELKSCQAGAAACARLVGAVAELLDEHDRAWQRRRGSRAPVLASSFNPLLLDRLARRRPVTDLAVLADARAVGDDWRSYAEQVGAVAVHPGDEGLTRERVEEIRSYGYGVSVWTVNSVSRAAELADWGATGVFTGRPQDLAPQFIRGL